MTEGGTRVGIIGVGNLGAALVAGWLRSGPDRESGFLSTVTVFDNDPVRCGSLVAAYGERVCVAGSVEQLVEGVDVVVVSLKPQDVDEVVERVGREARPAQAIVSTAAGAGLHRLRTALGAAPDLYRIMPNLAVATGEGVIALAPDEGTPPVRAAEVKALFLGLGAVEVVPEHLFDVVTAVGGSGPGFLALVLEALEDGAVRGGLTRAVARRFVRQMARGTAGLLLDDPDSAAALKDRVSSPGGTTIAGLAVLEDRGVRGALLRAVEAATERGRQL
ncbi:MAG: pyrroline-5-carboxylate reductase [Thermoleophilia bacterium]|nr:pyrroline-5-carboxylate reductase [Thermoleophilia bacterium]